MLDGLDAALVVDSVSTVLDRPIDLVNMISEARVRVADSSRSYGALIVDPLNLPEDFNAPEIRAFLKEMREQHELFVIVHTGQSIALISYALRLHPGVHYHEFIPKYDADSTEGFVRMKNLLDAHDNVRC